MPRNKTHRWLKAQQSNMQSSGYQEYSCCPCRMHCQTTSTPPKKTCCTATHLLTCTFQHMQCLANTCSNCCSTAEAAAAVTRPACKACIVLCDAAPPSCSLNLAGASAPAHTHLRVDKCYGGCAPHTALLVILPSYNLMCC
jgi:hypothetical protein